ncbi:hypothetical protein VP01_3698g1 [Puccinia sorghi]|uniref:Uncharacterized protein n=1 Tax=Puccinia sorghi TaxID=27349 RepID=A0A0L6UUC5_9BASI|nr:hypothetical protein VP01_3698g1 [Puccinia sorghi]
MLLEGCPRVQVLTASHFEHLYIWIAESQKIVKPRSYTHSINFHNWATWKPFFENLIMAKGYEKLMKSSWVKDNKDMLKTQLHAILAFHEGGIYGSFKALASSCAIILLLWCSICIKTP